MTEHHLVGYPIACGVALGRAHLDRLSAPGVDTSIIASTEVDAEVARLRTAVAQVRKHIEDHVRAFHAPEEEDVQQVLAAHILILDDQAFLDKVTEHIKRDRVRAERAVEAGFCAAADRLAASRDSYLRARGEDLRDICLTIRDALARGESGLRPVPMDRPVVFVTSTFHPSAVLRAKRAGAVGLVTSSESFTSHAALLLRALGLPSLGGVRFSEALIAEGTPLLVDADAGLLTIQPSQRTRRGILEGRPTQSPVADLLAPMPAVTADDAEVVLWANIDDPAQTRLAFDFRLAGIGLFRTELIALVHGYALDEVEQYRVYRELVRQLKGRPLLLRTFDLGSDKVVPGLEIDAEANPALGMRGVRRHLLEEPAELRIQLRAILRATHDTEAGITVPMVTHVDDIRGFREHLDVVMTALQREGLSHNRKIRVGAMIEVPAAALNAGEILAELDFAVIGTNDLSQYLAASDRGNTRVREYLDPDHSGLYLLLEILTREARELGRQGDILIGGELASDPAAACRFVELGFRQLIVVPHTAPRLREALATVHAE